MFIFSEHKIIINTLQVIIHMEEIRHWYSFCRKNTMSQLCLVYKNVYIPTTIGRCEKCGSTIDCVIQAKEKEFYLANSK